LPQRHQERAHVTVARAHLQAFVQIQYPSRISQRNDKRRAQTHARRQESWTASLYMDEYRQAESLDEERQGVKFFNRCSPVSHRVYNLHRLQCYRDGWLAGAVRHCALRSSCDEEQGAVWRGGEPLLRDGVEVQLFLLYCDKQSRHVHTQKELSRSLSLAAGRSASLS
jgi:hypothetical protein